MSKETFQEKEPGMGGINFELPESENTRNILDNLGKKNGEAVRYLQEKNVYQAPEISRATLPGYIAAIIEALQKGRINTWELSRQLKKRDGFVDVDAFVLACQTIESQLLALNELITPEERADFRARVERDEKWAAGVMEE